MSNREPSTHLVNVLNLNSLIQQVVLFLIGNGYEMNGARIVSQFAPLGLVTDLNGKHYLLDHEGCGTFLPVEDEKVTIAWCKNVYDEKGNLIVIGCAPIVESHVGLSELLALPVEKTVRLDEFVRVFGDRLDHNCANWDKFLSGRIDRQGNRLSQKSS